MTHSSTLRFSAPSLADAAHVRDLTREAKGSDLAFANIYLLQEKYKTTIAFKDQWLFRHFSGNTRLRGYAFPCGYGNPAPALELLRCDAAERNRPLEFCLLTTEQTQILEELYPGEFSFAADRGDADYLYSFTQLAELPGTAYHAKRNHIAQFERANPHWRFAALTDANAPDASYIAREWLKSMPDSPALLHEMQAISKALLYKNELELFGGLLYVDDQPIAMSIGSFISETVADIHYEKCLPEWKKAYPLINRQMARQLQGCAFINREEDLNQAGLRQAKLSYHPSLLLEKYTATPHTLC